MYPTRSLISFLAVAICLVCLSSCFGSKQLREDLYASREPGKDKFIVTTDNVEIESQKLTFKSPLFKAQKVVLDNGQEVKVKDVIAYQDDNAYYIRLGQSPFGFAHRMKRGPINMYRAITTESYYDASAGPRVFTGSGSYNTGGYRRRTVYHYFLEKDNSKNVVTFNAENVENMVSNYQPAMEFMDLYKHNRKKQKTWSIINTAAVIGGLVLATTSVDNSTNEIRPQGYVGTGLFFGGLINGFINKVKKAKNVKNLELAVDEYNRGSGKKKRS